MYHVFKLPTNQWLALLIKGMRLSARVVVIGYMAILKENVESFTF